MPLLTDGARIRELRELRGMTLAAFAEQVGFSVNHVSSVELGKGNGGPAFLRAASTVLNCEIDDITRGFKLRRRPASTTSASPRSAA
jgi:transcriptional regulator with XRE-family HTH domain